MLTGVVPLPLVVLVEPSALVETLTFVVDVLVVDCVDGLGANVVVVGSITSIQPL